jgi:hypothetical protein
MAQNNVKDDAASADRLGQIAVLLLPATVAVAFLFEANLFTIILAALGCFVGTVLTILRCRRPDRRGFFLTLLIIYLGLDLIYAFYIAVKLW